MGAVSVLEAAFPGSWDVGQPGYRFAVRAIERDLEAIYSALTVIGEAIDQGVPITRLEPQGPDESHAE
jgi:hypothetical protein